MKRVSFSQATTEGYSCFLETQIFSQTERGRLFPMNRTIHSLGTSSSEYRLYRPLNQVQYVTL